MESFPGVDSISWGGVREGRRTEVGSVIRRVSQFVLVRQGASSLFRTRFPRPPSLSLLSCRPLSCYVTRSLSCTYKFIQVPETLRELVFPFGLVRKGEELLDFTGRSIVTREV